MNLEAEISFFFGRTSPIICTIRTEGTAVAHTLELADQKGGEAIHYEITVDWHGKRLNQLLTEQFCYLQKRPPCPIEPGTAAESWEEMAVIALHKGILSVFRVYSNPFSADAQSNDFRIRHLCSVHIPPL